MREVLEERIRLWLEAPDSTVVYAEQVEGRWAVRVAQETRDATTVWFHPREVSMEHEAYFMPLGPEARSVLVQALTRNGRAWRTFFAIDGEGGLVLRGRLSAEEVNLRNLDLVLGEIVEAVEVGFRPMLRALAADRENSV